MFLNKLRERFDLKLLNPITDWPQEMTVDVPILAIISHNFQLKVLLTLS